MKKYIFLGVLVVCVVLLLPSKEHQLPLVAIANYGPHNTLNASIQGVKEALAKEGFIEGKTVRFSIQDVGFDAALIPQMVTSLKHQHPQVMVALTTPVAQFAKGAIHDIPVIYDVITDPVKAGLIGSKHQSSDNVTGSSDQQNVTLLLTFAKKILPKLDAVGLLYAPSETNDLALKAALEKATRKLHIKLVALPIMYARDVALVMPQFKGKVDMIYVGGSGPIQPTLPVIAAKSAQFNLPVFNVDEDAVRKGLVLASFGVNYYQVGVHAGELVAHQLKNEHAALLKPVYPRDIDHHGVINLNNATALHLTIPKKLSNTTIVRS